MREDRGEHAAEPVLERPEPGCGNCTYSRIMGTGDNDGPFLECHRRAPQMIVLPDSEKPLHHAWPSMGADDWCGDYSPQATGDPTS